MKKLYNFTEFNLETGIDLPEIDSNSHRMRQLMKGMQYGQSVVMPLDLIVIARSAVGNFADRFIIRKVYEDDPSTATTFRMWKVERKNQDEITQTTI